MFWFYFCTFRKRQAETQGTFLWHELSLQKTTNVDLKPFLVNLLNTLTVLLRGTIPNIINF